MAQFEVTIDNGAGGHAFVGARGWREAMAFAREWARGGDWDVESTALVTVQDSSGRMESETVAVKPLTMREHARLAARLAGMSAKIQAWETPRNEEV